MNILLIGPQGSGKGTQAEILVEKMDLTYIEMGGLLREAAKDNPTVDRIMNVEGKLVPDEITFGIVTEKINKVAPEKDNILFDGFPRSVSQYETLSNWFGEYGKKIDVAVLIDIPDAESVRRLSARRKCSKCGKIWNLVTSPKPPTDTSCDCGGELIQRADDTPEAIAKRLKVYHETTSELGDLLMEKGILMKVDGTGSIDEVTGEILEGLKKWA